MKRLTAGLIALLAIPAAFVAVTAAFRVGAAEPIDHCADALNHGDDVGAIKCLQPFADAGNAKAEMLLGTVYATVNLPSHDPEKSAYWTRKAAEQGDIDAQVRAGYLFRQGEGVPKDLAESVRWFRAAAVRGNQYAEIQLALMYFKGWGTPRDAGQALAWERKAAEQGGPLVLTAEESIAGIYLKGDGVPQDYAEAARWLRKAAEHGSPNSYLTLAQLDEKGLGGPPDPSIVTARTATGVASYDLPRTVRVGLTFRR